MCVKMIDEWNKGKWIFKDIHGYGYPYYHVHPYKQKAVKYLVENKSDWVEGIIIFGSSVQQYHMWFKDLDVCLIGKHQFNDDRSQMYYKGERISYDFLEYNTMDDLLKGIGKHSDVRTHICNGGVMVYEKTDFIAKG